MSCRPRCFVPVILATIALAVLICVPIYYFYAVYKPDDVQRTYEQGLPYRSEHISLNYTENGKVVCNIFNGE